jgi:hypothetical protein
MDKGFRIKSMKPKDVINLGSQTRVNTEEAVNLHEVLRTIKKKKIKTNLHPGYNKEYYMLEHTEKKEWPG